MRSKAQTALMAFGLLVPALASSPSMAQAQPEVSIRDVYLTDHFTDWAPYNAHDMLLRIPGFSIVEADEDLRGYEGTQGNVLIDGTRPSSKRESVGSLLKRIPARSVARIELLRAGRTTVDMAGHQLLANVVRVRAASSESSVEAGLVVSEDGSWRRLLARVDHARRWDASALELAFERVPEIDDDSGRGSVRAFLPDGALIREQSQEARATEEKDQASAGWRRPWGGGDLKVSAVVRRERSQVDSLLRDPGAGRVQERNREDEELQEVESGAQFERKLAGNWTLAAYASGRKARLQVSETETEVDGLESFDATTDTSETIGRVELSHRRSAALSMLFAMEAANNRLDGTAVLLEDDAPVDIPGSDVRMQEQRLQATFGTTWRPADQWTLEAGLAVEHSNISQAAEGAADRSYAYVKPRLAARWNASARNQLQLSLSREVGQLDFEDFVASASLQTGVVSAGNTELKPHQIWRAVAGLEHRFEDDSSVAVTWTHERITDVVDRVLVMDGGEVFDAPGNIGDGRRDTLGIEASAALDPMGLAGGHLRASLAWRRSEVVDPVTLQRRPISEEPPFEGSLGITQSLPSLKLDWGLDLSHIEQRETRYRYDEVEYTRESMGWTLFLERRLGARWRVRAEATDLGGREFRTRRIRYGGPRSQEPVEEIELRQRLAPGYLSLTFRRSTGG